MSAGDTRSAQRPAVAASASKAPDRLLDVSEAAALLSLKPSTLYAWSYKRRIPVVKLGGALRFRLSTLQKLMQKAERPVLN
jgi:excisionase family DNA binding protein